MTRVIYRERIPSTDPRLKRHIHHDSESRRYEFDTTGLAIKAVRHTRHVPVWDQGNLGSCFAPGTNVRMADGSERAIENVRLGEHVVTAEGNTGRVVRTMLRDEDGGLIRLSLWGHSHLRTTREHPVLTARGYVEARDLRIGDEVALTKYIPISTVTSIEPRNLVTSRRADSNALPEKIDLTPEAGRLFGLWLAEGSADGTKVRWTFGGHEGETLVPETAGLCRRVFGSDISLNVAQRPNGTWWVTLYGTYWNELFKVLGAGPAEAKRPHPLLCSGSPEFLEAMLDGWLAGDGCVRRDGSREGVSISHGIALAMYDIAQALGHRPVIDWRESPINSAVLTRKPKWTLTMPPGPGRCRQTETHVWRKVRKIELEDYVGPVYDLTVEGDHSYVAEGVGVHNCTGNAALGCLGTGPFYGTASSETAYPFTEAGAVGVYSAATEIDDAPGAYPPDDTGSDGLTVAKVLTQAGLISGYQHTFTIDDMLKALSVVPVIVGTVFLADMENPNRSGLVAVSGAELGGHEYIADEYDPQRDWIGFQNSWGPSWGVAGRFYMQTEDFGKLLARQGDVTVFTPLTQPAPTPSPSPAPVPPITADETFARSLNQWLASRPSYYHQLATDARVWLTAKNL